MIEKELIKQAKMSMGIKAAEIIASGLGLRKWDARSLKACCPKHEESNPSFIWNKKQNNFKCFGCGVTMDILDYYIQNNRNFEEAVKELFSQTNTYYDFDSYKHNKAYVNKDQKPYNYPISENNVERNLVETYLFSRSINKESLDARGIKQDQHGNIVFEYHDQYGKLLLVKYRPARAILKGENNKSWCQKDRDTLPLLYGMDRIDPSKPLLICEGEIDSLSAIEAGFNNVVSVPFGAGNYSWIEYNFEWLEQFDKFIIWSDKDVAGEKMRDEVVRRLGDSRCVCVLSKHKDINEHLCKEGKQSVLQSIENAKEIPIKNIIDLADVSEYDINTAEKIKSGFAGLDKWISGFVFGSLVVITGINSSGKSTLLNQMCICEPLEQGYDSFIFSGELQKSQLRSWIEFPMAGPEHVKEKIIGVNQPKGYYISEDNKNRMQKWYKGRIYLYDNEDDYTANSVLKKMEELAKRKGVKNFVIDNLMMINLECDENDKYKRQKDFVLELKKFARRYNAVVHLIAHPRKTDKMQRLTKLDVAGTADITNLADYVIAIHRVHPSEKEDRTEYNQTIKGIPFDNILDLFKNRPLGHQDKIVGLYFDMRSKRMFGESDNLKKSYSWARMATGENLT